MYMDVETAWQADLSDVAAGMIQRPALLTEMLDNWLDDYLELSRFHLALNQDFLDEHFDGVLPEFQQKKLRLVHDKLIKTFRTAYLASSQCPLATEFFRLLEHHKFNKDEAAVWLTDHKQCLKSPSWESVFIEVIGMITERVKLESKLQPPADPEDNPPDTRKELMQKIIGQAPGLKMKGEPDSILKRFRKECKDRKLPGINEKDGLAMIREIKGVAKRPRNTN